MGLEEPHEIRGIEPGNNLVGTNISLPKALEDDVAVPGRVTAWLRDGDCPLTLRHVPPKTKRAGWKITIF